MPNSFKIKVGDVVGDFDFHLAPGKNLYTGLVPFEKEFGTANSLEEDLLNVASAIYASDLVVKREPREQNIRRIELSIDVVNRHAFENVRTLIESALYFVSRDNWIIKFNQKTGTPVSTFEWSDKNGAVLLFSGGIDSLSGAVQLLEKKENVVLVSHNSHGNTVVDESQRNVHSALEKFFKQSVRHIHIKVYGRRSEPYNFPEDRENSQRTRSFLFLSLAALVTRRCEFNKVLFMAENGQFAIHLPLTNARVGPFSTHTADPQFVDTMREIFQRLLSNQKFEILNPFLYATKAEVVATIPPGLRKDIKYSASCWMISRVPDNKHCGYCIPCISRRIAIEFNNLSIKEYDYDVFTADLNKLDNDDDRKRNIIDYLEFISKFKKITPANRNNLLMEFPELYNPSVDIDKGLKLYERISAQSYEVLKKYPRIQKII